MDDVGQVLAYYPQIYFACHVRHRRDPQSERSLSERQASVLDHLSEDRPVSLKDLAQHLGVTASTMSLMVDRLVEGGWVERGKDPSDARRVALRLTAEGARIKAGGTVLDPLRVQSVLDRLTPSERRAALNGLALLARASAEEAAAQAEERRGN